MLRERIARTIFGVAIIALPLSYAVRNLLGYEGTWIDPPMVLGAIVFVLVGRRLRRKRGWLLIVLAFVSAGLGWYMHRVEPGHLHSALFVVMTDPLGLTLNLIWFWVCIIYFASEPDYSVRCVSISVICQLLIGVYLYLAMFHILPVPSPMDSFLQDYRARQVLWFSGGGGIPRMAGTFDESPLFGLFMLSCLAVLALELRRRGSEGKHARFILAGCLAAGIGVLSSLSDQILIAACVLAAAFGWSRLSRPGMARSLVIIAVLALSAFLIYRVCVQQSMEAVNGSSVYGESFGERKYNAWYGLRIFAEQPGALFLGIGPGRFGDYAVQDDMYREESTVQPGTAIIEWLVGYGLLGLIAIVVWLYEIGKRARIGFGVLGLAVLFALLIADMFQLRWLWEGWFTALAYLYASSERPMARSFYFAIPNRAPGYRRVSRI